MLLEQERLRLSAIGNLGLTGKHRPYSSDTRR